MNTLLQMTLFQLRNMMRNKIAFFFNLVMPLMFLVFFSIMFSPKDAPPAPAVGVVNLDQGEQSARLIAYLGQTGAVRLVEGAEADLMPKLTSGEIEALVTLPAGLTARMSALAGPTEITIQYDESAQTAEQTLGVLNGLFYSFGNSPVVVAKPTAIPGKPPLKVMDHTMPGALLQMLVSAGIVTVGIWLAGQRKTGALRHLFSTPLAMSVWVGARILSSLLLTTLQVLLLYAAAILLFDVSGPANLIGSILFLLLCSLATLGIGMLIGVFAPSEEAALPISMILLMGMLFLGGAMMPVQLLPSFIQQLAKFVPSYYMADGLRALMMAGESLGSLWPHLLVVGGIAIVSLSLATWRMRKQFVQI